MNLFRLILFFIRTAKLISHFSYLFYLWSMICYILYWFVWLWSSVRKMNLWFWKIYLIILFIRIVFVGWKYRVTSIIIRIIHIWGRLWGDESTRTWKWKLYCSIIWRDILLIWLNILILNVITVNSLMHLIVILMRFFCKICLSWQNSMFLNVFNICHLFLNAYVIHADSVFLLINFLFIGLFKLRINLYW